MDKDLEKGLKAELLEQNREVYNQLKDTAKNYKHLRNIGVFAPLVLAALWQPELTNHKGMRIVVAAGAVAISAVSGSIAEKSRKEIMLDARNEAESAYERSMREPKLPIPNWVKQELQIDPEV